jgi:ABC-type antimicrobial peptide transport system permease subunit
MVWVGLSQQLDRNQRELAVCRAIGFGPGSVRGALLRLCLRVTAIAVLPAVVILAVCAVALPGILAGDVPFPLPLGFRIPTWAILVTLALLVASCGLALVGALRRYRRADLASTLRSL